MTLFQTDDVRKKINISHSFPVCLYLSGHVYRSSTPQQTSWQLDLKFYEK